MTRLNALSIALFFFLSSLYALTVSTTVNSATLGEGTIRIIVLEKFVRSGHVDIGSASDYLMGPIGVGGKRYNWHEFGQNLFVLPFYLFIRLKGYAFNFANILATAITAVLILRMLSMMGFALRASVLTAAAYGTATFAWHYASKYTYEHSLGIMCITGALYFSMRYLNGGRLRDHLMCSFLMGIGFFTRYDTILLLLPLAVVYATRYMRDKSPGHSPWTLIGTLVLVIAPFYAADLYYGYVRFGEFFKTGRDWSYVPGQATFSPDNIPMGILGAFISPGKSIFVYAPILTVSLFFVRRFAGRLNRDILLLFALCVLTYTGFYVSFFAWDGEICYGPRYFLVLVPFLIMPLVSAIENFRSRSGCVRAIILCVVLLSIALQLTSVMTNTSLGTYVRYGPNNISSDTMFAGRCVEEYLKDNGLQGTWSWLWSFFRPDSFHAYVQARFFIITMKLKLGLCSTNDLFGVFYSMNAPYMVLYENLYSGFDLWWLQIESAFGYAVAAFFAASALGGLVALLRLGNEDPR